MKTRRLVEIAKKIIFSSSAILLVNGNTNNQMNAAPKNDLESKELNNSEESLHLKTQFNFPKFILHKSDSPDNYSMSHRSHRSHSSHRSHYSGYNEPKTDTRTPTTKIPKENKQTNDNSTVQKIIMEFGDRILKRGMEGTDVVELQDLLKKLKISEAKLDGNFGETTEVAVKKFQQSKNIDSTGVVDVTTFYYLKLEKDKIKKQENGN